MADDPVVNGIPVAGDDIGGVVHQQVKIEFGGENVATPVDAASPLPVTDAGAVTQLISILAAVDGLEGFVDGLEAALATLNGKDFSTQTTLAAVLAKLSSDPATQTTLAAVLAKLSSDPATQTTLAAVLAKLTTSAASPLATRLSDGSAYLNLATVSDRLKIDVGGSLPAGTNNIGDVDVLTLPSLPAGSNTIGGVTLPGITSAAPLPVTDATPSLVGAKAQSGYDVTTASTAAVAARAGRTLLQLINTSDTPIWIAIDTDVGGTPPAASVGNGIWLGPNGGSWSEGYTGAVRAIHAGTGTKRLSYIEF